MVEFLLAAAVFLLVVVGAGLARLLLGPTAVDRIMAVQMLGTGGSAICVLLAVAKRDYAILVVAITLSMMAAFAVAALGKSSLLRGGGKGGDHAG